MTPLFISDQRNRICTNMVCTSLAIGAFYLPIVALKAWHPIIFSQYPLLCIVMDALSGYVIINHLLNSCLTSIWNFTYAKYPLWTMSNLNSTKITVAILCLWTATFVYVITYVMTISRHMNFEAGCLSIFYSVPYWFIAFTVYGLMVPSVILILIVNTCFLVFAREHMVRQRARESRSEQGRSSVSTNYQNQGKISLTNQQESERERLQPNTCDMEISTASVMVEERLHENGGQCPIKKRVDKFTQKMSIFMFLCIIVWIPTIIVANIIAVCPYCGISVVMLEFISGVSHAISANTPPLFFLMSRDGKRKIASIKRKFKMRTMSSGSQHQTQV